MTSEDHRAAVVAEALTWLRTPYHHHARLKGVGVDCAQLLVAVYEACCAVDRVELGDYSPEWHLHRSEELYMQHLLRYARLLDEDETVRSADIALYRFGRTFSHGAIVLEPGTFIHAYKDRGVIVSTAEEEPLQGRDVQFWRVIED
jgi:NlpC/P60 family putative phage cell wall peptidase